MTPDEFKQACRTLGWSVRTTAKRLGYSPSTIQRWRCGKSPIRVSVALVLRVAQAQL